MTASGSGSRFGFPAPLFPDGVAPGTNILVEGSVDAGAREVALRLLAAETYRNEGQLLLSADVGGRRLLDEASAATETFDPGRVAVVDCSGIEDEEHRFDQAIEPIDGPGDLMAIEMAFATLYETLRESGYDRVRMGVFSISTLLAHSDLQTVSRFVHMLTGRVIATGDLGVFHIDSTRDEDVTVDIFEGFCDRCIEVRRTDSGSVELRRTDTESASEAWQSLDAQATNEHRHHRS